MRSLFPVAVVYRSSNVHARGRKAENLRYSFRNSIISTYIIFYVTVGSEVKPGGYTKKTRIVVLFFFFLQGKKKKKKVSTFQLSLNHS